MFGEPGLVVNPWWPARDSHAPDGVGKGGKTPRMRTGDQWVDTAGTTRSPSMPDSQKILDTDGPSGLVFDCSITAVLAVASRERGRQVDVHGDEDTDGADSQSSGVQLRVHATHDMGVGEPAAVTRMRKLPMSAQIGGNPYETQTNYFLAHWIPNMQER